jgi:hypothetical protein
LLSPDELRARAAAAASAAPVQTHQLNHLRKAAEEAVQQQKLQQLQQQQRSKRDSKASSVAQQPLSAVRAAAASARTTPAPASGEAVMSQQAPSGHTERSTTGDPRVGDTDMAPAVALKELRLDALDGEVPDADPDYTPPPPSAPAPASALSSFLAFLFGEDDAGGGDVAKARSRMCCVLPIGGMPVVEHEPSMQKVPSLLLDEDR